MNFYWKTTHLGFKMNFYWKTTTPLGFKRRGLMSIDLLSMFIESASVSNEITWKDLHYNYILIQNTNK